MCRCNARERVLILINLKITSHIHEVLLKNLLTYPVKEEGSKKVTVFDADRGEDKVRPILKNNFEIV